MDNTALYSPDYFVRLHILLTELYFVNKKNKQISIFRCHPEAESTPHVYGV